ncbi:hypothetical protein WG68_14320 [Arsukibacterium ikkense]|uniref:Anti-sigma factor n=1 Tax=Arsukibacterium ikkense TaxID=336831 RepID=A0A0M2V251_9GAMM|nr:hypothetical protein [Arsukibacterium ikkense]KKO44716.1 hypothetical protein WG68_14320 [Arsukibacterium ikkense]
MITDEQLSAFLDNELPESQMQLVRQQLAIDPLLSDRLAQLAATAALVSRYSSAIEQVPLSANLQKLLEPAPVSKLAVSAWQRLQQIAQQQLALAASVALLAGFLLGQFLPLVRQPLATPWPAVFALLENAASGQQYSAGKDYHLFPQLTFKNKQQQFCRHFILREPAAQSENIACRLEGNWQLVASYREPLTLQKNHVYQLASSAAKLDPLLDQLIEGPLLDAAQEQLMLDTNWQ